MVARGDASDTLRTAGIKIVRSDKSFVRSDISFVRTHISFARSDKSFARSDESFAPHAPRLERCSKSVLLPNQRRTTDDEKCAARRLVAGRRPLVVLDASAPLFEKVVRDASIVALARKVC